MHSPPVEWGPLLGAGPVPLDSDIDSDLTRGPAVRRDPDRRGPSQAPAVRPGPARKHPCCPGPDPPATHAHTLLQSGCSHCFLLLQPLFFIRSLFGWILLCFCPVDCARSPATVPGRFSGEISLPWALLGCGLRLTLTCSPPSPPPRRCDAASRPRGGFIVPLAAAAGFVAPRRPGPFRPGIYCPARPEPARPVRPGWARLARSVNRPGPARGAADPPAAAA